MGRKGSITAVDGDPRSITGILRDACIAERLS
jgi:hypothetical protein